MSEKFKVIYPFKDLKAKDKKEYKIGDEYVGSKVKARLNELLTKHNKIGTPLIKKEVEKNDK